jgi:peptidoglycan L-alanyl-D-glutamate endopeptidase CwlK
MDAASENKLASVAPELAARVRAMASALTARGITIRVVSGLRSTAQQAALYANRASNRNPVAAPGTSLHEKGLAVDLSWSGGTSAQVGAVGEALGLRWGGRFSRPDPGHFELTGAGASSVVTFEAAPRASAQTPIYASQGAGLDAPQPDDTIFYLLIAVAAVALIARA